MTIEPEQSFGDRLRRLRQAAGLSQEELAERAGLTPAAVGMLERGERRRPYPHTLQALADALGLSPTNRAAFFTAAQQRGASVIGEAGDRTTSGAAAEPDRWSAPPLPLTPFVGRERDVAIVAGLFQHGGARLVTLTGPGGVGKTRLAIEVAALLRDSFETGPVWVDLAPVREPDLVLSTIARALGLVESAGQDVAETLESYLGRRQALLVVDNFEHLLATAPAVPALLERCPRLSILATSREALRVRGEHEVQVPPLGLPDLKAAASAESVARSEAASLFLQRVRAVRPGFVLTDAEAPRIAAICARLDGIPLALELAAVQLKYTSPSALLDRLKTQLALLEGGPRDLPSRQQSLRATIAWSYALLTASEQNLFRRLAVFAGGFTTEAVQDICGIEGESPEELARTMAVLVDKSVVQAHPDQMGEVRFAMLETIREYARERLIETDEEALLADRHAAYFCALAEEAAPHLPSAERGTWLPRLDVEVGNLRAALGWATTRGDPVVGLRLAGALGWFWTLRGYIREGTHWTDLLLALPVDSRGAIARASALGMAAALAWKREDYPIARRQAEESVATLRALGDRGRLPIPLAVAGLVAASQGDLAQARQFHEECLSLYTEQGDRWGIAYALANLGDTLLEQRDLSGARRYYTESLWLFSQIGDPWGRGIVLHTLGNVAWAEGDVATARDCYAASIASLKSIGKKDDVARGLIGLAAAMLAEGEAEEAKRLLIEGLALWRDFGSKAGTAVCLAGLASVQASRGRFKEAARLFGVAQAHGGSQAAPYVVDADMFSRYLRETQERLGEASFARARAEGEAITIEEALAYIQTGE